MKRSVPFIILTVASLLGCATVQPMAEPIENPTLGSFATGADPLPPGDRWTYAGKLPRKTVFKIGIEYCVDGDAVDGDQENGRNTALFQAELAMSAALVGQDQNAVRQLPHDVAWWPHLDSTRHDVLLCVAPPAEQLTKWSVPTFRVDPFKAIAATIPDLPKDNGKPATDEGRAEPPKTTISKTAPSAEVVVVNTNPAPKATPVAPQPKKAPVPKPPVIVTPVPLPAQAPFAAAAPNTTPVTSTEPAPPAVVERKTVEMTKGEVLAATARAWQKADASGDKPFRNGESWCSCVSVEISNDGQKEIGRKFAVALAGGILYRALNNKGWGFANADDVVSLMSYTYSRQRGQNIDTILCVKQPNGLAAN